MIPRIQSRTGPTGTCFRTSLAMILNLREDEVPDFAEADRDPEVNRWLARYGLHYREVPVSGAPPRGWHIITGVSPRGGQHAVVGYNGVLQADPHPFDGPRHGLDKEECWGVLESVKGRGEDMASQVVATYRGKDIVLNRKGSTYKYTALRSDWDKYGANTIEAAKAGIDKYLGPAKATDSARRAQLHRALDAVMDSLQPIPADEEVINGWHIVQDSAGNYVCTKPGYVDMNIKTLPQARRMCEAGGTKVLGKDAGDVRSMYENAKTPSDIAAATRLYNKLMDAGDEPFSPGEMARLKKTAQERVAASNTQSSTAAQGRLHMVMEATKRRPDLFRKK